VRESTPIFSVKTNLLYRLPVAAYCIFIFWQSSYASPEGLPSFAFSDKILHMGGYALLGLLVLRALLREDLNASRGRLMAAAIAFSVSYGITDEVHQSFVSDRVADGFDLLADTAGAVMGVLFFDRWHHR